jgi:hypothetical protein
MGLVVTRTVYRARWPGSTVRVVSHDVFHLNIAEELDDIFGVRAHEVTGRRREHDAEELEAASWRVSGPFTDTGRQVRDESCDHIGRVE